MAPACVFNNPNLAAAWVLDRSVTNAEMTTRRRPRLDGNLTKDASTESQVTQPAAQQSLLGKRRQSHCHSLTGTKEKIARLERSLQGLNEQLSFAHAECFEKDAILSKQAKVAEEAILGWEKAEAEAIAIKTELDDTLHQKAMVEQRICQLDEALNVAAEERELLIKDTAQIISCEKDKVWNLEQNVAEKENIIASLDDEYSRLSEILSVKEKIILDLTESNAVKESDLKDLAAKLESTERSNSSLRYEVCMLQKQLDIRSEERKCNLKSADASHKQHLENVRKITKLEEECKRLRSMIQNSSNASHVSPSLLARLHVTEDENKAMKESLSRKDGELQLSRTMLARTTSKLSQVEAQLEDLSGDRATTELAKRSPTVIENPLSSISEGGRNEDNVSCSGSWASALISELEHFKNGKLTTPSCKSTRMSDLSFMDDFEEIERLAMVCDDKPSKSYDVKREATESAGKELVPVDGLSETTNQVHPHKTEKGLLKLIELVEGVIQRSSKDYSSNLVQSGGNMGDQSTLITGYFAHAFLWKTSELTCVLRHFIVVCNELLYGNTDVERFVLEVSLTLDWILNHCFSLQDVSEMRETIIKHLHLDSTDVHEAVAAKQIGVQATNGIDEPGTPNSVQMSLVSASSPMDIGLKADNDTDSIRNGVSFSFHAPEVKSSSLRAELNALKETGNLVTHGVDGKSTVSELDKHKSIANSEVNKGSLQGSSHSTEEDPKCVSGNKDKNLHTQLEISTASEKLIECQETILNLGKQLKALSSPKDATSVRPERKPRSKSLNEMLAVDDGGFYDLSSPKTKEIICSEIRPPHERKLSADEGGDDSESCYSHPTPVVPPGKPYGVSGTCKKEATAKAVSLAVVPSKHKGNPNLLKRILTGRRRDAIIKPKVVLSA
uniref:Filament-like plant protein 7 n=1 Tax=Aegilops tauschii TaxID=37682 RepID=M8C4U9_AEGTA